MIWRHSNKRGLQLTGGCWNQNKATKGSEAGKDQESPTLMYGTQYYQRHIQKTTIKLYTLQETPKIWWYHIIIFQSSQKKSVKHTIAPSNHILEAFLDGHVGWGSWFDYTRDGLEYKHEENILFIEYENFILKTKETIGLIGRFLGKELSEPTLDQIADIISFDSMCENPNFDFDLNIWDESKGRFLRKGKVGDWKNH